MAIKCQGWVFLEDWARRPALRMARMVSSGSRSGEFAHVRAAQNTALEADSVGDVYGNFSYVRVRIGAGEVVKILRQ
jgi:hypothetical protein